MDDRQIHGAKVDHLASVDLFPGHPRDHAGVVCAEMGWIHCERYLVDVSYFGNGLLESFVACNASTEIDRRYINRPTSPPPAIVDVLNSSMNTCLDLRHASHLKACTNVQELLKAKGL